MHKVSGGQTGEHPNDTAHRSPRHRRVCRDVCGTPGEPYPPLRMKYLQHKHYNVSK